MKFFMKKPRRIGDKTLMLHSFFVYLFLYAPIVILIIFSFNTSKLNAVWRGFTFDWYIKLFQEPLILRAFKNSMIIAIVTTILSTIIGTLLAFGMNRYEFFGKRIYDSFIYLPIIIPEIIEALSLLIFFSFIGFALGLTTVIIGHTAFDISFVAVIVRARLAGFDRSLEEAAMDLGADEVTTFFKITLPLIMPGILAGALLAFTLSFDDYLKTAFTAGVGATTLPLQIYSMIKFGVTPSINALSTISLLITLSLILLSQKYLRSR